MTDQNTFVAAVRNLIASRVKGDEVFVQVRAYPGEIESAAQDDQDGTAVTVSDPQAPASVDIYFPGLDIDADVLGSWSDSLSDDFDARQVAEMIGYAAPDAALDADGAMTGSLRVKL